jgi:putative flippase GtrA
MFEKYFVNYLLIGIIASSIDVILFWLFFDIFQEDVSFANAISVSFSALFSFTVNSLYNFKKSDKVFLRLLSFIIVITVGYFAGLYLILFLINFVGIEAVVSKLISLPVVFLIQYFLNSSISFR